MRYLTAKGVLDGLAVLICQLRRVCAAPSSAPSPSPVAGERTGRQHAGPVENQQQQQQQQRVTSSPCGATSISTGPADGPASPPCCGSCSRSPPLPPPPSSRPQPPPSRPLLVLRRRAPAAGAALTKSQQPPSLLLGLARRVAELIEAILLHPRAPPRVSRPAPATTGVRAPPPPTSVGSAPEAPHGEIGEAAAAAATTPPPLGSAAAAAAAAAAGATSQCLTSGTKIAETKGGSSPRCFGAIRAIGSLISLLAVLTAAEKDQRQPRRRESPQSLVLDGRKGMGESESLAAPAVTTAGVSETTTTTTTPLSDGFLRLAYVVVRVANRACLFDLHTMQVCLRVLFCHVYRV